MGNVKWHACFVAFLWIIVKTDWIMLICEKHVNQLVRLITIMWIRFSAEMPVCACVWVCVCVSVCAIKWWTQCTWNHNAFTNPSLTRGGGTPHAALPEVSKSSGATFPWFLLLIPASCKVLGGLLETHYYPNDDHMMTCKIYKTAIWITQKGDEDDILIYWICALIHLCDLQISLKNAGIQMLEAFIETYLDKNEQDSMHTITML